NDRGTLRTQWIAGEFTKQLKPGEPFFECKGTHDGAYDVVAGVTSRPVKATDPVARRRTLLGTEKENSGNDILRVERVGGVGTVGKGEQKELHVRSREVKWHSGKTNTNDRTVGPLNTSLVVVRREKDGRRFFVDCYRED